VSVLGIIYVHYKFPPGEGQLSLALFALCTAALVVGSLVSVWLLITQWSTLTIAERCRLVFSALFL
jgi:hypothetical protein